MIRLCKNLFYKPKYGSDADSIMLKRLFSTVTVVLVCLAAISFSAYAFFSYSVTSGSNTIQSSSFSTSVTIQNSNDETIAEGKLQSYLFMPDTYTVTFNTESGTTGTGFYIISVNGAKYYTQQLGKDLNAPGQERTQVSFALDVKADTTVAFEARWGTTSYYGSAAESEFYIKNSDPMQIIVVGATDSIAEEETEEEDAKQEEESISEETTPEESTAPTESEVITYIVEPGDYLSTISAEYGMHHTRLAAYNNILPPYEIHPGEVIKIPPEDWVEPTVPTEVTE